MKDALQGRNIKMSAVCAGFDGFILSTDPEVRKLCRDSMEQLIIAAGEFESTGVIIVPAFNSQVPVMAHTRETRDFLLEQFDEMGTLAQQHGTTVILEPLNRRGSLLPAPAGRRGFYLPRYRQPGRHLPGRFLAHDLGGNLRLWGVYLGGRLPAARAYREPETTRHTRGGWRSRQLRGGI